MIARRTLTKMAGKRSAACGHTGSICLHHDHLLDLGRQLLCRHLRRTGRLNKFRIIWPSIIHKWVEEGIIFRPTWLCVTCNEVDGFLKQQDVMRKKANLLRQLPKHLSLAPVILSRLRGKDVLRMSPKTKRIWVEEVRAQAERDHQAWITKFQSQRRLLVGSVSSI